MKVVINTHLRTYEVLEPFVVVAEAEGLSVLGDTAPRADVVDQGRVFDAVFPAKVGRLVAAITGGECFTGVFRGEQVGEERGGGDWGAWFEAEEAEFCYWHFGVREELVSFECGKRVLRWC